MNHEEHIVFLQAEVQRLQARVARCHKCGVELDQVVHSSCPACVIRDVEAHIATSPLSLEILLAAKREWSLEQFGEGLRTDEILRHVLKEVEEIRAEPTDLVESVDLALLAMDLFWRGGGKPEEFLTMLWAKFRINVGRKWVMGPDGHAEHVK